MSKEGLQGGRSNWGSGVKGERGKDHLVLAIATSHKSRRAQLVRSPRAQGEAEKRQYELGGGICRGILAKPTKRRELYIWALPWTNHACGQVKCSRQSTRRRKTSGEVNQPMGKREIASKRSGCREDFAGNMGAKSSKLEMGGRSRYTKKTRSQEWDRTSFGCARGAASIFNSEVKIKGGAVKKRRGLRDR